MLKSPDIEILYTRQSPWHFKVDDLFFQPGLKKLSNIQKNFKNIFHHRRGGWVGHPDDENFHYFILF